ncbi:nucleotidyltransferase domain-containing protein (plasmid) [Priestia koreensis]|nr:nucleotidyltransferase domain-containing protein [Priestia koreensis]UNL87600.1 nucleotidyltransferase domain-containing protein [Priestia koreensis]
MDEETINVILDVLKNELSPNLVYLFGSQAAGNTHTKSDFDIAYLGNRSISHYERFMLAQQLASTLNRDVDLIDLNKSSTVFQAQVVGHGKVLYCTDENGRLMFEMLTFKKYARLNEERKEILDTISKAGQVFKD